MNVKKKVWYQIDTVGGSRRQKISAVLVLTCSGQHAWHSCLAGRIVISEYPQGLATRMVHLCTEEESNLNKSSSAKLRLSFRLEISCNHLRWRILWNLCSACVSRLRHEPVINPSKGLIVRGKKNPAS